MKRLDSMIGVSRQIEIQIANSALDVHLLDLERHQEWRDYIKRKKSGRKSASNASNDQPTS